MAEATIVCDPQTMGGKPVLAGTRITVELILEKLGAGESISDLLEAHPNLTMEGIQAALAYAARTMRSDRIYAAAPLDE